MNKAKALKQKLNQSQGFQRIVWDSHTETTKSRENSTLTWQEINWKQMEKRVFKLQKRIYQASCRGDVKTLRGLQKVLIKSWSAKCLAVRRVTQENKGKKTAGVDGVKSLTPSQRLNLVKKLQPSTKVKPTRRVWIPKPGKDEKRPLGIPTMYDRALQALVKMALEPQWEALFEPNSYGFRPGRSCHDAIEAIKNAITQKAKYVLDADIAKCFDHINHQQLLRKLNTYPALRRLIRAWLKAGVMDKEELFETGAGTPQGGVISPLLANIALHGMEQRLEKYAETLPGGKRANKKALTLVRYADDFVVVHEHLSTVLECQAILSEWLNEIGLEMKPEKTKIVHTLDSHDEQRPGFDFLGFHIRQYKVGKYKSGCNGHQKLLGFKTIVKPSETKIQAHYQHLADIIDAHKAQSQGAVIKHLNPVIRGWANYYSSQCSKRVFTKLDHLLYLKLARWAKRRHPNKNGHWITDKYWHTHGDNNWIFSTTDGLRLIEHAKTPIIRHTKVKGTASPFDGSLIYWSSRMGKHPELPKLNALLLKKQKGKCPYCGLTFIDGDVIEKDHIIPRSTGGLNEYKNFQLLHRHCHDQKTRHDGSQGNKSGCNRAEPKPLPKFVTDCPWIDGMLVTRCI